MAHASSSRRLFFQEFRRNFHTTGAVLPSGRFLAAALARHVGQQGNGAERVMEVGPGTGAVTRHIIDRLRPEDSLDLVELNDAFVGQLKQLLEHDDRFHSAADRTEVLHMAVEDLPDDRQYDRIVSGLPLNNFSAEVVRQILTILMARLRPGGTLSFFEYIAIRRARLLVSGRAERCRLRGIGEALHEVLHPGEFRRDWIWWNVPPAWVHHVKK